MLAKTPHTIITQSRLGIPLFPRFIHGLIGQVRDRLLLLLKPRLKAGDLLLRLALPKAQLRLLTSNLSRRPDLIQSSAMPSKRV